MYTVGGVLQKHEQKKKIREKHVEIRTRAPAVGTKKKDQRASCRLHTYSCVSNNVSGEAGDDRVTLTLYTTRRAVTSVQIPNDLQHVYTY